MKIGLMGFDFMSPNKGCEALTYSFINMLIECFGDNLEIKNFSYGELGVFPEHYPHINFKIRRPKVKNPIDLLKLKKEMSQLDIIFDVTFGDGFSDIYGVMWNVTTNILKEAAILSGTPLVLLPQTYGPYKKNFLGQWAKHIVKKSALTYSRDIESAYEMNKHCSDKVEILTDMAFALPYNSDMYTIERNKINVGINISSLLWDSVYASENKFDLKTDYRTYITSLIDDLLMNGRYKVHLIPHVIDFADYQSAENDLRVCDEVKNLYKDCNEVVVAPAFTNPIDAKSYISNMDVFTGARMHATIGALSSGVATIPFAYSKKFKTMFGNLNYSYVIEARELDTNQALQKTKEWIVNYEELMVNAQKAKESTVNKLSKLKEDIKCLI